MTTKLLEAYISVDCVIFGFDGAKLNLLLVQRESTNSKAKFDDLKLPGSIILNHEDTDIAAQRVLSELTGIKTMKLKQFRCFSSTDRTANTNDLNWLVTEYGSQIKRLITVAYIALTKIDRKLNSVSKYKQVKWVPIDKITEMPFDHNLIVDQSLTEIKNWAQTEPAIAFELLPAKFSITELRKIYEAIYNRKFDVRNFQKKISTIEYIQPLDEYQQGVAHRAARLYKFDKTIYNKRLNSI